LSRPFALAVGVGNLCSPGDPGTGTIIGRVVDNRGSPLPGAALVVTGTGRTAVTDATGFFRISQVPAGSQTLEISYLGFEPQTEEVEVQARAIIRRDIVSLVPHGSRRR